MGILKEVTMSAAFAKIGFFGGEGSGKSTTSALVAIGIHKLIGSKKPVAWFDTENGMDYILPLFQRSGVPLIGSRSQAFKDLGAAVKECEAAGIEVFVVDSITHPWRELVFSYKKERNINLLSFADWGPLKDLWRIHWATPYVHSKIHIIMNGRAQNVFEDIEEEEPNGRKRRGSRKTGTKMATEGETGYEPSLLVEFARDLSVDKRGGVYGRRVTVIKDRFMILDGQQSFFTTPRNANGAVDFERLLSENAPMKFFGEHIKRLNLGGEHVGVDPDRTSAEMFDTTAGDDFWRERRERDLYLAQVPDLIAKHFPGRSAVDQKAKGDMLEAVFDTRTWEVIQAKTKVDAVKAGLESLRWLLEVCPREMLTIALGSGMEGDKVRNANASIRELRGLLETRLRLRANALSAGEDPDAAAPSDQPENPDADLDQALPIAPVEPAAEPDRSAEINALKEQVRRLESGGSLFGDVPATRDDDPTPKARGRKPKG